jgi:hypothetical protein
VEELKNAKANMLIDAEETYQILNKKKKNSIIFDKDGGKLSRLRWMQGNILFFPRVLRYNKTSYIFKFFLTR